MIALFTDFGWDGPYVGQLKLALARHAPAETVIDLMHDVPPFDARGAAYLLAALVPVFPENTVFVAVVDPGVGGERAGLILQAGGRTFVGPDNGLFERVFSPGAQCRRITWQPQRLSASFHGRDLFAPVAAMLAAGSAPPADLGEPFEYRQRGWPEDLARVVYVDRFGNAMTGIRAGVLGARDRIEVPGAVMSRARTFSDLPPGRGFWYENSCGLVEVALNQGSAAQRLGLGPGDPVRIVGGSV